MGFELYGGRGGYSAARSAELQGTAEDARGFQEIPSTFLCNLYNLLNFLEKDHDTKLKGRRGAYERGRQREPVSDT